MNDFRIAQYMQKAIDAGKDGVLHHKGGPFGAIVVYENKIIGTGCNMVTSTLDPTAHAEIVAIRSACKNKGSFSLQGATLFTSCEPCPMCLSAIYWARLDSYYYAATKEDAKNAGFDDCLFYEEINKPPNKRTVIAKQLYRKEALQLFSFWANLENKISY